MRHIAQLALTDAAWQALNSWTPSEADVTKFREFFKLPDTLIGIELQRAMGQYAYQLHPVIASVIPLEAKLMRIDENHDTGNVYMLYEHESFQTSSEGSPYPRLNVTGYGCMLFGKDIQGEETDGID